MEWYEWLCHTNFSFLIGASHPHECVQKAVTEGYRGLAITDYDGVYGIVRAYRAWRDHEVSGGMRLFYGVEIHLDDDHHLPLCLQKTLVLLAQSYRGYQNLCRVIGLGFRYGKQHPRIKIEDLLSSDVTDMVALQPMRGGIRYQSMEDLIPAHALVREHFQNRLYFVLSRHWSPAEDVWIPKTIEIAARLNSPIIMSHDSYFHTVERKKLSDLLHGIRHNCHVENVMDQCFVNASRHLPTIEFLQRTYKGIAGWDTYQNNSHALAATFDFDLRELRYRYPQEMLPPGVPAADYLRHLVMTALEERYGDAIPEKVLQGVWRELKLVRRLEFEDYFLTVYDIVMWAKSQGILCQGRGSAANSAICYFLGITSLDPSRFDLLFERFISVERGDPPDIDVDFEHERREEVIQYIYRRYGRHRAAMVCNVITFRNRGALRAVAKALGIKDEQISALNATLQERQYRIGDCKGVLESLPEISSDRRRLWGEFADQLRGFPRHLGIHSGGFMLSHTPMDTLCPQEPATMDGRTVIQWAKEDIEFLGFFKVDILALGMLTAIRKTLQLIQRHYDISMTLDTIPAEDEATYSMMQKADTVGVFQIESRAQMAFLPRHKPRNFYDLVVEVAIIRPGPIQGGMIQPYLRRRSGVEPVVFPDPRLEPILRRTFGVPIFQEQVMRIAMAVGGFTPGEADQLRKNIGAFSMNLDPQRWVEKLAIGMRRNGISEGFIDGIVGQIMGFASYGFPESHAASFALLAYASAYLKCHFPAAFFTALLNSQPMGFYSADILVKTVAQLGIRVLPICVQCSTWDHQLERVGELWGIRLGFRLIRGLRQDVGMIIANKRGHGGWAHPEHLVQHCRLGRQDLIVLALADSLISFGWNRREALWYAMAHPTLEHFPDNEEMCRWEEEEQWEKVQGDYSATGVSLGEHPAALFKKIGWCYSVPVGSIVGASLIKSRPHGDQVKAFGLVTCRQSPPTARGMLFMTMWDEEGSIDLVLTPPIRARYGAAIHQQAFLCIKGKVQKHQDSLSVQVSHIYDPAESPLVNVVPLPTRKDIEPMAQSRNYY